MFFNTKPKNRRREREHVLDVKLRSQQVRAARWHWVSVFLAVGALGSLAFFMVFWGGRWTLDTLIYQNNAFNVAEIDVTTDGIIAPSRLRQWSGVKIGDNLLALDLQRVKRDLELAPMIESVSVERVLPGTLRLRVSEREPIAQVLAARPLGATGSPTLTQFYLDDTGHVITPLPPSYCSTPAGVSAEPLPIISGINVADLHPGQMVDSQKIAAALRLVARFELSPMFGLVELASVDLSGPEILEVNTSQGARVTFGLNNLDTQLRHWRTVHDYASAQGKAIASLDLSISNNLPARWLEASAVPALIPKTNKSSRHRKSHVL